MTLEVKDVKPGSETDPNDFFGGKLYYFQYGVKPSIDTEYYYTGIVKKSTYETFADDEAFMKDVVGQAGELIMMNCFMGENNAGLVSTPTPFKGSAEYSGTGHRPPVSSTTSSRSAIWRPDHRIVQGRCYGRRRRRQRRWERVASSGRGWKYDDSRATHGNVSRVFFAAFSDGCAGKSIMLPFAGLRLKKRSENLE